ncbi:MAG: ATP-grasp domain-containing protein [Archaeoglobi archaeon]|nr:ATP-grasp domain-containing protein [Candidatus Mnemosynella bozhongmuii]
MSSRVGILTSKAGITTIKLRDGLSKFLNAEIIEMSRFFDDFSELKNYGIAMNYINSRQQITLGSIAETMTTLINDVSTFMRCKSKALVSFLMRKNGIPVPETFILSYPYTEEKIEEILRRVDFPLIVKPNSGSCGKASILVREEDDLRGVLDYISAIHEIPPVSEKIVVLQEYVRDARDLRAFFVGDEIVAVEERVKEGGWKKNLAQGAHPERFEMSEEQKELIYRASKVLGVKYAGFDILSGEEDYILEVNPAPGLKISEIYPEIFEKIAKFLKEEMRR